MKNMGLYGYSTKKNCKLESSTRLEILLKVHSCRFENLPIHDRIHVKKYPENFAF